MFLGTYITNFTGKGRLALGKKFRLELGEPEMILMKGLDGGIWGFSIKEWNNFTKDQLSLSLIDKKGREVRRNLFPFAEKCELDSQGRFVVPDFLIKMGKLGENVVFIGAGDHFEIWDLKVWQENIGEDR
jgi:MraZ protein